jgi:hypothetical protein
VGPGKLTLVAHLNDLKGLSGRLLFQRSKKKNQRKWSKNVVERFNPKYVDLCDEDQPLARSLYVYPSFLQKVIRSREFPLWKFVHQWDLSKSIIKSTTLCIFIKYNIERGSYRRFVTIPGRKHEATREHVGWRRLQDVSRKTNKKLNEQRNRAHSFQTSTRG